MEYYIFSNYYENHEPQSCFSKTFVSLWNGWLGKDDLHKLDQVSEAEWRRFNDWLREIARDYLFYLPDFERQALTPVDNVELLLVDFQRSQNKTSDQFIRLVIPELECIITEDWDYTYIVWHKNNGALERLDPLIRRGGLKSFSE